MALQTRWILVGELCQSLKRDHGSECILRVSGLTHIATTQAMISTEGTHPVTTASLMILQIMLERVWNVV
jgi:hypothetical protein